VDPISWFKRNLPFVHTLIPIDVGDDPSDVVSYIDGGTIIMAPLPEHSDGWLEELKHSLYVDAIVQDLREMGDCLQRYKACDSHIVRKMADQLKSYDARNVSTVIMIAKPKRRDGPLKAPLNFCTT
jgi:hypothetical protein